MLALLNVVINILLKDPLGKFMENGFDIARPTLIVFGGYTIAGMILWIYSMIDAKRYAEFINTKNDTVS